MAPGRKAAVVVKEGLDQPEEAAQADEIRPEELVDDSFYLRRFAQLVSGVRNKTISALDAAREKKFLTELYKDMNGHSLSEASRRLRSPVERLEDESLLEKNEGELDELLDVIKALPGVSVSKKKRWRDGIALAKALQAFARSCSLGTWLYVCRDAEGQGGQLKPADMHIAFHENWKGQFTLTEAPTGHGKTVNFQGKKLYDIGHRPWRRCLFLNDIKEKAQKELNITKKYIRSRRFQAIYPDLRVLTRADDAKENAGSFTVVRPNEYSREATVEAAGIRSNTQGSGYDTIYADDVCKPDVANHPAIRAEANFKWENEHSKRLRDPETAEIHMVYTPWDDDDVPNRIKRRMRNKEEYRDWSLASFPLTFDENGQPIPLWSRYSADYYRNEQASMLDRDFARIYLLQCNPPASRIVKRLWYYPADINDRNWDCLSQEVREAYLERLEEIRNGEQWLSIDPSASSGKGSAECPVAHFSLTAKGYAYLVDIWFFPGDPVMVQEWLSDAICQELSEGREWRLPHRVDKILWEDGSPQKGQLTLWEDYIRRDIKKRGVSWHGSFIRRRPIGQNSRQAVGKRIRLQNSASYLNNGFVKFPGMLHVNSKERRIRFVCSNRESIKKLVDQIQNFPRGLVDGVDATTQFIIYNESRLKQDLGVPKGAPQQAVGVYNSLRVNFKRQIAAMKQPQDQSDMERESKWMSHLVG